MTTPADRARALLAKFGPVTESHRTDDGYWDGSTTLPADEIDLPIEALTTIRDHMKEGAA